MGGDGSGRTTWTTPATKIAERFRRAREACGITQLEAAARAGTRSTTVSQYEAGQREPKLSYAYRLAKVYGVSLEYLAGAEEGSLPPQEGTHA